MWGSREIEREDVVGKTADNFKPVILDKINLKN